MGRHALLIANSDYNDPRLNGLTAPSEDVVQLRNVLIDPQIGEFETAKIVNNSALVQIQKDIQNFVANRDKDDVVLIYFTGHGLLDDDGKLWLALAESTPENAEIGSLEANKVTRALDRCASRQQILILDCCHSGAIDSNIVDGSVRSKSGTARQAISTRTFGQSVEGRYVLASSSSTQLSYEVSSRSLFTRALVDGLRTGAAAPEKDEITLGDIASFISKELRQANVTMNPILSPASKQTQLVALFKNPAPSLPMPTDVVAALNDDVDVNRRLGALARLSVLLASANARTRVKIRTTLQKRLDVEKHIDVHNEIQRLMTLVDEVSEGRSKKADLDEAVASASNSPTQGSSAIEQVGALSKPSLASLAFPIITFATCAILQSICLELLFPRSSILMNSQKDVMAVLLGIASLTAAAVICVRKNLTFLAAICASWFTGYLLFSLLRTSQPVYFFFELDKDSLSISDKLRSAWFTSQSMAFLGALAIAGISARVFRKTRFLAAALLFSGISGLAHLAFEIDYKTTWFYEISFGLPLYLIYGYAAYLDLNLAKKVS
jgi:hypothetical protein